MPVDLTRIYALVSKVASDDAAAAARGDKLIAALAAHLQDRRAMRDRGAPEPRPDKP